MIIGRFRELIRAGGRDPFACPEGGKNSTPPAPDYRGAALEQSAASKELATQNTFANRPTLNTPWGNMSWQQSSGTDPSSGTAVTNWTGNLNLSPEQQSALDAQQRITSGRSDAAEQLLGQATSATATPMDWNQLPQRAGTPQARDLQATTQTTNEPAFAGERQRIEQALFDKMRPEHQRAEAGARTRLANMGLSSGSEAYNRELERLSGTQASERFNALQTAGQEQQRMQSMLLGQQGQAFGQQQQIGSQGFGQELQSANFQNQNRQAAIAEEAQRRGMPLSELNALLTGQQVNMPTMPSYNTATSGAAPNLLGAATAQGQYGLDAAKLNQSGQPDFGTLLGTAGKLGAAYMTGGASLAATGI